MKTLFIPVHGTRIFDMRPTRGYVAIRHRNYYHKFFTNEEFNRWFYTGGIIETPWGDTVSELLTHHAQRTPFEVGKACSLTSELKKGITLSRP